MIPVFCGSNHRHHLSPAEQPTDHTTESTAAMEALPLKHQIALLNYRNKYKSIKYLTANNQVDSAVRYNSIYGSALVPSGCLHSKEQYLGCRVSLQHKSRYMSLSQQWLQNQSHEQSCTGNNSVTRDHSNKALSSSFHVKVKS